MARMSRGRRNQPDDGLTEKVININRVAKVVKGGRRFSFSAIVVVGDGEGKVGVGFGKANEVPEAIRKASTKARANMFQAAMVDGTVPHKQVGNFGAGQVLLLPAAPGTGVIAGPSIRAILDAAGYHNVLTKCLGTNNSHNVVRATLNALHLLETPEQYAVRVGKDVSEVTPNYVVGEAHWASIQ